MNPPTAHKRDPKFIALAVVIVGLVLFLLLARR